MFELIVLPIIVVIAAAFAFDAGKEAGWKDYYRGKAKCETVFEDKIVCRGGQEKRSDK